MTHRIYKPFKSQAVRNVITLLFFYSYSQPPLWGDRWNMSVQVSSPLQCCIMVPIFQVLTEGTGWSGPSVPWSSPSRAQSSHLICLPFIQALSVYSSGNDPHLGLSSHWVTLSKSSVTNLSSEGTWHGNFQSPLDGNLWFQCNKTL